METVTSEKLMNDLRVVVGDAEDLLKATANQGGEQVARIRARAEESLRAARGRLKEAGDGVNAKVHENPWTAVGVAAGVGLLLGFILGRK